MMGVPLIECDYGFLKSSEGAPLITVPVASDTVYKHVVAIPLEHKGSQDSYAARCLAAHIRFFGVPKISVQGDAEHALMSVVRAACDLVPGASPREALVNCKDSNGIAERALQTMQGMSRTLRLAGVAVSSSHAVTPWLVRHAGWLQSHFGRSKKDKKTAYELHFERACTAKILPFVERVMWREPSFQPDKLKSQWGYGVWLGRAQKSDAHIIGTRLGIVRPREGRPPPSAGQARGCAARPCHARYTRADEAQGCERRPRHGHRSLCGRQRRRGARGSRRRAWRDQRSGHGPPAARGCRGDSCEPEPPQGTHLPAGRQALTCCRRPRPTSRETQRCKGQPSRSGAAPRR